MNKKEKDIIVAFAKGDDSLREQAITIHRKCIASVGVRGNAHQEFMAEVDHPCPDYGLRRLYRERLLHGNENAIHDL